MDVEYFSDDYEHVDINLVYTGQNVPGPGVDEDNFQSQLCIKCDCLDYCKDNCKCISRTGKNYSDNGLLVKEKLIPNSSGIVECNSLCSCMKNCGNRLVQFGPVSNLEIFYDTNKGYCLKTNKPLKKGNFICEYAGEVISRSEAKSRIKNLLDVNYIFLLQEHSGESLIETIVDPTYIGNIARYINHSCEPNAVIVPVRFDSVVPHLGIFALCDIAPEEEITYDYSGGEHVNVQNSKKYCFCGKNNCKKFIPFNPNLL